MTKDPVEKAFDEYMAREYPTDPELAMDHPAMDHFAAGYDAGRLSRNGLREALDLFKPLIEEDRFGMISDEYRKAIEAFDKAMAADEEAGK